MIAIVFSCIVLQGCSDSAVETGEGSIILDTPEITVDDNELDFTTEGIDESKITYIYVANKKVMEEKIKNNQEYSVSIEGIKDAHRTDYEPKVQLIQYKDDDEDKDMTTFKQVRYKVVE